MLRFTPIPALGSSEVVVLKRSRSNVWDAADTGFLDGLVRGFLARRDQARQQRLMASEVERWMRAYRAKLNERVRRGEISSSDALRYLNAERRLARRQSRLRLLGSAGQRTFA
jgi:hypothetical protein